MPERLSYNSKILKQFNREIRPVTPEDPLVKYAVDDVSPREKIHRKLFLTLMYLIYIFCGGGIFVALEGPTETMLCNQAREELKIMFEEALRQR